MEFIEGESLSFFINKFKNESGCFGEKKIWNITVQLILALKYLHKDKNIIHRDLSANNIMLDNKNIVKITDFGLAKFKETNFMRMTPVVGNLIYMCPEIIKHETYNEKADIWSFGCLVYQMCCLEPPFYSNNMLSLVTKVIKFEFK